MELGLDTGHMMKHQYAYRSVGRRDIPSVSIGFGDRLKTVRTLIKNYLISHKELYYTERTILYCIYCLIRY
jgi:hypothetical protein